MCTPDLLKILNGKVQIQGDESLCKTFLSEKLAYFKFDKSHMFSKRNLGGGDTTIHISEGSLYIDINNDGQNERLIGMNMYSGRGDGCDQEYTLQVNEALSEVLKNKLNELLQPISCRYYTKPFQYKNKVYIENRAARLDAKI